MKIALYSNDWPSGRCLLLARELASVSEMGGTEALHAATSVFGFNHRKENPLGLTIHDEADTSQLKSLCREFGIMISS